jgi:hypothetical protein
MEYKNDSIDPGDWDTKVFQSAHLYSGRYSPSRHALRLQFGLKPTDEWEYLIPRDIWDLLKESGSPGSFFSMHIRPNIPGRKIEKEKSHADV